MNFFKKSLLVSVYFLGGIHATWGAEEVSPDEKSPCSLSPVPGDTTIRVIVPAPRLDEEYRKEERERHKLWQERYKQPHQLTPDVKTPPQDLEKALATLKGDEKPLAYRGEIYGGGSSGKKAVTASVREDVAYVSPARMHYLQRTEGFFPIYEAFAVPQGKAPQIGHGAYSRSHQPEFIEVYSLTDRKMVQEKIDKRKPSANYIVFDPGHGIDHAITITHNGSNSTADVRNYTPQNSYYNRHIRNPLVQYAEGKKYSYKELAIYAEHPLFITRKKGVKKLTQPIPEGFVFCLFKRDTGKIEEIFYFPNFDSYSEQKSWEFFAQKYKVNTDIGEIIWGHHEVTSEQTRRLLQNRSEHVGYRSLSGRFEVLPEGKWLPAARNALIRTVAVYQMERAAEYDVTTENMLQIAQIFNDEKFVYAEFEGSLHISTLARYWIDRALKEVKRKDCPAEDVFFFMNYDRIPITSEEMRELIESFEQKLQKSPNAEHIAKLLQYFDEQHNEEKYRSWSDQLSLLVRNGKVSQSVVIDEKTRDHLIVDLANTDVLNIVLDFEINQDNVGEVIEGLKQRAINEKLPHKQSLVFLELPKISLEALDAIFHSFEDGIEDLYVDVMGTAVKLPSYNREKVQTYVGKKYPQTRIRILN